MRRTAKPGVNRYTPAKQSPAIGPGLKGNPSLWRQGILGVIAASGTVGVTETLLWELTDATQWRRKELRSRLGSYAHMVLIRAHTDDEGRVTYHPTDRLLEERDRWPIAP
jgi:hypothetical protein